MILSNPIVLDLGYSIRTSKIDKKPYFDHLNVYIYKDDKKIGEYIRNYDGLYKTFYPFEFQNKHYALYSKDYTATRLMSLPDCKDLGGEDRDTFGFCPVEYHVQSKDNMIMGFVAGCVWGDDNSWKIQAIQFDFNNPERIVKLQTPFGYIALLNNKSLKDSISCYLYEDEGQPRADIEVISRKFYDLNLNTFESD